MYEVFELMPSFPFSFSRIRTKNHQEEGTLKSKGLQQLFMYKSYGITISTFYEIIINPVNSTAPMIIQSIFNPLLTPFKGRDSTTTKTVKLALTRKRGRKESN